MNKKNLPDIEMIKGAYLNVIEAPDVGSYHSIIQKTEKELRKLGPYNANTYLGDYSSSFDITASNDSLERALNAANLFIKVTEQLGYKSVKGRSTFKVDKEIFHIRLKEFFKQVIHVPTPEEKNKAKKERYYNIRPYDLVPSGELAFVISANHMPDKVFRDKSNKPIENQIVEIIAWIARLPQKIKEIDEQRRLDEKARYEAEKRRIEYKFAEAEETRKIDQLIMEADDFNKAIKIYEYIQAIESRILTMKISPGRKNEIRALIKWAQEKADWINPIIASDDPLLGKKHRNRLFFDE